MSHTRWEYLTLIEPTADEVRNLGIDGWELVGVVYDPDALSGERQGGRVLYFKRALPER